MKSLRVRPVLKVRSPARCSVVFFRCLYIRISVAPKLECSHLTWAKQSANKNNADFDISGTAEQGGFWQMVFRSGWRACVWGVIPQRVCDAYIWFQPL